MAGLPLDAAIAGAGRQHGAHRQAAQRREDDEEDGPGGADPRGEENRHVPHPAFLRERRGRGPASPPLPRARSPPRIPRTSPGACADLTALELIDMRIGLAEHVPAGDVPAHCRGEGGSSRPRDQLRAAAARRLERPVPDGRRGAASWGSVQNQAPLALRLGWKPPRARLRHGGDRHRAHWQRAARRAGPSTTPERQENFGHRAVHLTAETAKSVISHYYARPPDYDYFVGCSRGGGQAMMASQRYPDDFDGIVAAAPAYDWTGITRRVRAEPAGHLPGRRPRRPRC